MTYVEALWQFGSHDDMVSIGIAVHPEDIERISHFLYEHHNEYSVRTETMDETSLAKDYRAILNADFSSLSLPGFVIYKEARFKKRAGDERFVDILNDCLKKEDGRRRKEIEQFSEDNGRRK